MAANPDCLSDLPDDLLLRILRLLPGWEAASTAALSRRWRGVWPAPVPAVRLDTRPYDRARHRGGGDGDDNRCNIDRDAFFHDAEAALDAHAAASGSMF
ncbi:unnamed protein product [Urochloa humidicola]